MKHFKLFENFVNESYQDLLKTMEVFQEPINDLDSLERTLQELNIEGVDAGYIERKYAERVQDIKLELSRLMREFQDDESMWQSKGRFRKDAEIRSNQVWSDIENYQRSKGY